MKQCIPHTCQSTPGMPLRVRTKLPLKGGGYQDLAMPLPLVERHDTACILHEKGMKRYIFLETSFAVAVVH